MCVGARSDVTGSKERSTYRSWCGGIFWIPVYPLMRTDVKSERRGNAGVSGRGWGVGVGRGVGRSEIGQRGKRAGSSTWGEGG